MGSDIGQSECMRGRYERWKMYFSNSLSKDIQNFLEGRARVVRETSDLLAQLAREKLLDAR